MGGTTGGILLCLLLLAKGVYSVYFTPVFKKRFFFKSTFNIGMLCVSTANTSPSVNKKVYFVCEDTPIGTCVWNTHFFNFLIQFLFFIVALLYHTLTNSENVFKCCVGVFYTGDHAFDILASDPDGEALTFALTGSSATFFSVESNTGRVSVRAPLDREVWWGRSGEALCGKRFIFSEYLCVE